jgi:hypothetical protein
VPLSGEEIRRRLGEFVEQWRPYQGTERAEAQTFLNQLLSCYGTDRGQVARFEEPTGSGFIDLIWPRVCIVEMKRPSQTNRLAEHREQALEYWRNAGTPQAPAPRYVVLCAFHTFEVWEPGAIYREPRATFTLEELPDRLDALLFLAGAEPVFVDGQEEVTRYAVALVTDLYTRLRERRAAEPDVLRNFLLQCVWSMFAEDLQMLPTHMFTRLLDGLFEDPRRSSADDLGQLFRHLAEPGPRPDHGVYAGAPYANGGLFGNPASVHLEPDEVAVLRAAAREFDWKKVEPSIFGSLLQGALGRERQWALGAHYTAEADILEIVRPTIVDPWRQRIAACRTLADVVAAQNDLMQYVVLDPACGSGNFLYVAYRELRRIEAELRRRATDMRRNEGLREQQTLAIYFPLSNIKGIEIDPFAVQLARVTMWMGHKLAVEELHIDETVLPLADLSGIQRADALATDWPRADAIIGNPPYHGSQRLRGELGDDYVEWLRREFGIGVKDFAVYWFRKAHARLGDDGRAGLVATNSISQTRNRPDSLEWITSTGGTITHAISSKDWSGEAAVDVSIVNWVKAPSRPVREVILDGRTVDAISPALHEQTDDLLDASRLNGNLGRAFQGPQPVGAGFVLARDEAMRLLDEPGAQYADVVRPYLIGDDIMQRSDQSPSRYIIDFGTRALEDAMEYPKALAIVRERVKPVRDRNRRRARREHWWLLGELVRGMRRALAPLDRYIATSTVAVRFHFVWCDESWCPSNRTTVIALDDDFSMGVLSSRIHQDWAMRLGGTFEDRPHYTHRSTFETYPFPGIAAAGRAQVEALIQALVERRRAICQEREIGLTRLYNEVEEGAYRPLAQLHRDLDEAVAAAYGWPVSAAHDPAESNRLLLELNRAIAAGELEYRPFDRD